MKDRIRLEYFDLIEERYNTRRLQTLLDHNLDPESEILQLHDQTSKKYDFEVQLPYALVDKHLMPELTQYEWYFKVDNIGDPGKWHFSIGRSPRSDIEIQTHKKTSLVLLHRHILALDIPAWRVLHVNGNFLDCRLSNLVVSVGGTEIPGELLAILRDHWISMIMPQLVLKR